jgi:hypothetical protein
LPSVLICILRAKLIGLRLKILRAVLKTDPGRASVLASPNFFGEFWKSGLARTLALPKRHFSDRLLIMR